MSSPQGRHTPHCTAHCNLMMSDPSRYQTDQSDTMPCKMLPSSPKTTHTDPRHTQYTLQHHPVSTGPRDTHSQLHSSTPLHKHILPHSCHCKSISSVLMLHQSYQRDMVHCSSRSSNLLSRRTGQHCSSYTMSNQLQRIGQPDTARYSSTLFEQVHYQSCLLHTSCMSLTPMTTIGPPHTPQLSS